MIFYLTIVKRIQKYVSIDVVLEAWPKEEAKRRGQPIICVDRSPSDTMDGSRNDVVHVTMVDAPITPFGLTATI